MLNRPFEVSLSFSFFSFWLLLDVCQEKSLQPLSFLLRR
ncbi:hypothetical protein B4119_2993 [Parageobacillus caldoxylosilyticus]|uniref:Uncharacterized protein n=1 Tax=Saccharococcus caldoxylosilyticus TaxID=81408 RepID=A0A150LTC2_9BACL|nr:hypothetical protein B4119_2993 [Parageobacillus caldoxylosilyticus]